MRPLSDRVRFRREYNVTHGRDGHQLAVRDCWRPAVVLSWAVETAMAALGHPCCGNGIGRIPSDRLNLMWFKILNWPCSYAHRDRVILSLPLTIEQAAMLRPDLVDDHLMFPPDGADECGYTWRDAVMVGTPDDDGA